MKHYFAYGTLLDLESMQSITPSAKSLGTMKLDGYRMGFAKCHDGNSGGCTLVEEEGGVLYGIQYEMSDEDLATLDKAAGVDKDLWRHRPVAITDQDGNIFSSSTYFIPNPSGPEAPTDDYVRPILNGLATLPVPLDYIEKMKTIIKKAQANA